MVTRSLDTLARPRDDATSLPGRFAWVARAAWPNADVRLDPSAIPPGFRPVDWFSVISDRSGADVLVPSAERAAIGPSLERWDDGTSFADRWRRRRAARAASRSLGRLPQLLVSLSRHPLHGELVAHVLREVLDRPDLVVSYPVERPADDRPPLALALTSEGRPVAVAKIGWNERTNEGLLRDMALLRRWDARRPRAFSVPRPIHLARLPDGRVLTVVEPTPSAPLAQSRRPLPPLEAVREIASMGGLSLAPLGATPFWRRVVRELETAGSRTACDAARTLHWLGELHGRRSLWHGSWHGDWTQGHTSTLRGRPHIWHWDRAADGVPLGLDILHFAFEAELSRLSDIARAADVAFRSSGPLLGALGVPKEDRPILMASYLGLAMQRLEAHGSAERWRDGVALLRELKRWAGRC